ncbi:MAG: alpha/beta fold hydrolase [Clostridia bacterium]|jgi:carboxylesterase|nr:alpha/beta fold hydrolase [Clostridia bacterium]
MNNVCVIIHGFGGGLKEIAYLKEFLQRNNQTVETILLAGHGVSKKELGDSTYLEWLSSADRAFRRITRQYDSVTLIGFSMGGLIATYLANKYQAEKIVLVNTPVYFWNVQVILKSVLQDLRQNRRDHIRYYQRAFARTPVRSGLQFLHILAKGKEWFQHIKCPTLILQCRDDESVKPKSAAYIESKIKAESTLKYYEGGCHQIFSNACDCRESACRDILGFIKK